MVDGLLYLANPNSADCSRAGIGSRTPPSMLRATEVSPLQARKLHWSHRLTLQACAAHPEARASWLSRSILLQHLTCEDADALYWSVKKIKLQQSHTFYSVGAAIQYIICLISAWPTC